MGADLPCNDIVDQTAPTLLQRSFTVSLFKTVIHKDLRAVIRRSVAQFSPIGYRIKQRVHRYYGQAVKVHLTVEIAGRICMITQHEIIFRQVGNINIRIKRRKNCSQRCIGKGNSDCLNNGKFLRRQFLLKHRIIQQSIDRCIGIQIEFPDIIPIRIHRGLFRSRFPNIILRLQGFLIFIDRGIRFLPLRFCGGLSVLRLRHFRCLRRLRHFDFLCQLICRICRFSRHNRVVRGQIRIILL